MAFHRNGIVSSVFYCCSVYHTQLSADDVATCCYATRGPLISKYIWMVDCSFWLAKKLKFPHFSRFKMSMSTSYRYEVENPSAKTLKKALQRQQQRIEVR